MGHIYQNRPIDSKLNMFKKRKLENYGRTQWDSEIIIYVFTVLQYGGE